MRTIDEAIIIAETEAKEWDKKADEQVLGVLSDGTKVILNADTKNYCEEKTAEHRQLAEWLRELKKDREILDGLSIYFQSLVVDAVINQRPLIFDMRDATKEERESVKQYIADSAETTGVNFWSIIEEVKTDE